MRLDQALLAEKTAAVEHHLARVTSRLPADAADLKPLTDATDSVVLHLWLAVQLAIDLALWACVQLRLGAPATYADAFRALAAAGHLDAKLADELVRAAGFRNVVAHAYEGLDLARVHTSALHGPGHLRAFLAALARLG